MPQQADVHEPGPAPPLPLSTPSIPQRATSLANLQPQHRRLLTIASPASSSPTRFDRYLNSPGAHQAA
ncbi:hypothetical protein ACFP53_34135 [Streptomyces zhihengii]